jgi:hypothetical protein
MSRQKLYKETRYEPEEWILTDPVECVGCGEEFDLDDDDIEECSDGEYRCWECREAWEAGEEDEENGDTSD